MSPSTAPASIEASWPGSPTRISRASGCTASASRAISDSETIEVSSTITTSCGSRLPRLWRKRLWLSGRQPSSRCSVEASSASSCSRTSSETSSRAASSCTARSSRSAALPVGAASATSGGVVRLLHQQRHDPGDRGRLAGARPAGDDREPPQHGGRRGEPLRGVGVAAEQPRPARRAAAPRRRPPPRRTRPGRRRSAPPRASSGRGRARCRRAAADRRSAGSRRRARATPPASGHGSAAEVDGLVLLALDRRGLAHRREVHVARARAAARARPARSPARPTRRPRRPAPRAAPRRARRPPTARPPR